MLTIQIDTKDFERFQRQMYSVSKSAVPIAISQTLNKTAFDVKMRTMPKESDIMVHRKPTFFKANSGVTPAKGLVIDKMVAQVGFNAKPLDTSHSVEDLEEQEFGGDIPNRSFVALETARNNGWNSNVKNNLRLKNIRKKLVKPKDDKKGTFIKSAIFAFNTNKGLMLNTWHNRVIKVVGIIRDRNQTRVIYKDIYKIKKHGKARVKRLAFMEKASAESALNMEKDFIKFANIQISKIK